MARAGIREVAERAGVSISTVSNVLNKPGRVSAPTAQRVNDVMNEIGFVRNELARQLRTGGTNMVGTVVLNVANPFFAALLHAIEASAEEAGCVAVFGSSDQLRQREERYLEVFEEQRVKGIMIAPLNGVTPTMRRLRDRGMPMVVFDASSDVDAFCSVALDGRIGGYLAARHLISTGRTHIAFLGGPLRQVEDRWTGALRACAETSGVRLSHIDTVDQTIAEGRAAGEALQRMPAGERPDAVFAANDLLALGLMQSLIVSGSISIPRDIAIIGYDDIDYAQSASLPLSTVRQPVDELAATALSLLLAEIEDGPEHVHRSVALEPELIVRDSTPPAG